jgi:DNA-directed RNA polymerase subunit alpha
LIEKTESEMLKYRNFGKKSLQEIKSKLQELGLSLGMAIKEEVRVAFHQKLESLLRKD